MRLEAGTIVAYKNKVLWETAQSCDFLNDQKVSITRKGKNEFEADLDKLTVFWLQKGNNVTIKDGNKMLEATFDNYGTKKEGSGYVTNFNFSTPDGKFISIREEDLAVKIVNVF